MKRSKEELSSTILEIEQELAELELNGNILKADALGLQCRLFELNPALFRRYLEKSEIVDGLVKMPNSIRSQASTLDSIEFEKIAEEYANVVANLICNEFYQNQAKAYLEDLRELLQSKNYQEQGFVRDYKPTFQESRQQQQFE